MDNNKIKQTTNNSKQKKDINIEIENKIYYTQMANQTVRNKHLTGLEKSILLLILSHNQEKFTISRKTLFNSFADSQHMIRKSLLGLKNKNYLKIVRTFGKWIYKVNDFGLPYHNGREADNVLETDSLPHSYYKNNNLKNINKGVKPENVCEEKKEKTVQLNNIEGEKIKAEPEKDQHTPNETYSNNSQDTLKTSLNRSGEVLNSIGMDIATIFPDSLKIENIDNSDIEHKYDLQIKEVTTKYNHLMSQIPKLTTSELIGNSEKLMSNLGIGFDDNPRRILNKIYNSLPNDHSIMEDSKDIELVQEIIGKYKSSNPETRSAISKRLYQALELMIKIYYIKKYGEEYRGKLYPEIIDKNLVLYLNCNPTLKYCYSGFSNDIDGVFEEVKRLINKKNQKIIDEIENEKQKELSRLEAYRKDAIHSAIPEEFRKEWQDKLHNLMTGKSRSTETVNVIPKRTEQEELEFNQLREETAELFKAGIRPETWMRERLAELSAKKSYY